MHKIQLEECQVLAHYQFDGKQRILTLASNKIPNLVKAGQFVHLTVDSSLKMRRPISVMSVDIENNSFDLLYKIVGEGTKKLATRQVGEYISILGPIGNGFDINSKKRPLLIGGGVGMPPMIAIAQQIKDNSHYQPYTILGSEVPFPFDLVDSKFEAIDNATKTMPLLEEWGIRAGLASLANFDGVFNGYVTDLAKKYLNSLTYKEIQEIQIYSCGPHPMLEAVAKLAQEFNIDAQLSLEEFMACGVGGCAGCVVKTIENGNEKMQRVCVDGPVFEAKKVFYN